MRPRTSRLSSLLPTAVAFAVTFGAIARTHAEGDGNGIRVLMPTPLAANSDVPGRVKEECKELGRALPAAISRENRDVVLVNTPKELTAKSGRYFLLEIVEVHAPGGGVWSGPKFMRVRGVAYANGKQVGDVEAQRGSTMAFSACGSLEKVEKALGQDLAKWLESPKPHDKIK